MAGSFKQKWLFEEAGEQSRVAKDHLHQPKAFPNKWEEIQGTHRSTLADYIQSSAKVRDQVFLEIYYIFIAIKHSKIQLVLARYQSEFLT